MLSASDLPRPWRLLRTRAPWTALLYLLLEVLAGALAIASWVTVLLIPVWILIWPRLERLIVPFAGVRAPRFSRGRWEMRWQDVVLVLLTALAPIAAIPVLTLVATLLVMLFGAPIAIAFGRTPTTWDSHHELPALPVAIIAPVLGILVLALVLWGATALAFGWGRLSAALLGDEERRLAAQVEVLGDETVRITEAVTEQRAQIERDLHDGAQMHLSAAGLRLALLQLEAESLPDSAGRRNVLDGIDEIRSQIDATSRSVRDAVDDLTPSLLRDEGLEGALPALARAVPLDIDCEVHVPRLPEAVERGVHLVASEALTNVLRHAQARHVLLRCEVVEAGTRLGRRVLALTVSDDGHGGAVSTGTGIVGMGARARALGGELTLASPEGGPTDLALRVPIEEVG